MRNLSGNWSLSSQRTDNTNQGAISGNAFLRPFGASHVVALPQGLRPRPHSRAVFRAGV